MFDFGLWPASQLSPSSNVQSCESSIKLRETATHQVTTLCGGNQRVSNPYVSATNVVDVSFTTTSEVNARSELLLKYDGMIVN